jgi:voltage-gated potassium channel
MRTFHNVFKAKRAELTLTVMMILLLLIFASSAMYAAEQEAQPDKFSSIPETLWWGVVTLTTIGYGDVYPITPVGRVIGGIIPFLGIGLFCFAGRDFGFRFLGGIAKAPREAERLDTAKLSCDGLNEFLSGASSRILSTSLMKCGY